MNKKLLGLLSILFIVLVFSGCTKKDKDIDTNTDEHAKDVKIDDNYDKNGMFSVQYDFDKMGEVKLYGINGKKEVIKLDVTNYNNDAIYYSNGKVYYHNKDNNIHTYEVSTKKDETLYKVDNIDLMKGNDKYIFYYYDKTLYVYDIEKKDSKKTKSEIGPDNIYLYSYKEYAVFTNSKGIAIYNAKTDKSEQIVDKNYIIDYSKSYNNVVVYIDDTGKDTNTYYYNILTKKTDKVSNDKINYLGKYNNNDYNLSDNQVLENGKEYMKFENNNLRSIEKVINSYTFVIYEVELDLSKCKDNDYCDNAIKSEEHYLLNLLNKKYDKLF